MDCSLEVDTGICVIGPLLQINVETAKEHEAASFGLIASCGYKQTSSRPKSKSALPPKADILAAVTDFRV